MPSIMASASCGRRTVARTSSDWVASPRARVSSRWATRPRSPRRVASSISPDRPRMRAASSTAMAWAKASRCICAAKASGGTTNTSMAVRAVASWVRGEPSSSDISPNQLPGSSTARMASRPSRRRDDTLMSPSTRQKKPLPATCTGSPWRNSSTPGGRRCRSAWASSSSRSACGRAANQGLAPRLSRPGRAGRRGGFDKAIVQMEIGMGVCP